jgi:chaperonin cofactor prefoldin
MRRRPNGSDRTTNPPPGLSRKLASVPRKSALFAQLPPLIHTLIDSHVAVIDNNVLCMNILSTGHPGVRMDRRVEPLRQMKRRPSSPSARLLRAVAAERNGLRRRRDALLKRRRRIQTQLDELDGAIAELDERLALISRLDDENPEPSRQSAEPEPETSPDRGGPVLRGPAIRAAAVKALLTHPQRPQALHYRQWFDLLEKAGYNVAGKDPLAVFLTQLSRSPLVRRSTQSGVYELDLQAPTRLRQQLEDLQAQLRKLTASASSATADLGSIRSQRTALSLEINKVEKALQEAQETLHQDPETPGIAAAS